MWHRVKDLSPDQRAAIEGLLGRRLADDEGLNIQPSHVLREAPEGEERAQAYKKYLDHAGTIATRAEGIGDEELEAAVDEACDHARHSSS